MVRLVYVVQWAAWWMAVMVVAGMLAMASGQPAEAGTATIRTHQGMSYVVTNLSLEVFYTIGEPKERPTEQGPLQPTLSLTATSTMPQAGSDWMAGGDAGTGGGEQKLLRGRSQVTEIPLGQNGARIRIPLAQISTLRFARTQVPDSRLPVYVPHFRYTASASLIGGEQVMSDNVQLGTMIFRGTTTAGWVEIPWEEIESVSF